MQCRSLTKAATYALTRGSQVAKTSHGCLHHLHGYIILSTSWQCIFNSHIYTMQTIYNSLHAALSMVYIMQSKTGDSPAFSAPKMATVNLQELEAFFLSLKDECCESVLEISMKCVRAMKLNQFSEAVRFNQVRKSSRLCRRRSTYVLSYASRAPGPSVYTGAKPTLLVFPGKA